MQDVDFLINLKTTGDFYLHNNSLKNINGLKNLQYISDNFNVSNNFIENVNSLSNLTSVFKNFYLNNNPSLNNINGLSNLTSVGGILNLTNTGVTDYTPLSNLVNVGSVLLDSDTTQNQLPKSGSWCTNSLYNKLSTALIPLGKAACGH